LKIKKIGTYLFYIESFGFIDSRMYVFIKNRKAIIIDPQISNEIKEILEINKVKECIILLTHEHYDHISGVNWWREQIPCKVLCSSKCGENIENPEKNSARYFNALFIKKEEANIKTVKNVYKDDFSCKADMIYNDEIHLNWEGEKIYLREAPGHSEGGSLIFFNDNIVFTGDNLVNGNLVITRLPGGKKELYKKKVQPVLEALSPVTWIFPGHGEVAQLYEVIQYAKTERRK